MRKASALLAAALLLLIATARIHAFQDNQPQPEASAGGSPLKATMDSYLGKPYVWGASGLKSFDCSGFVWRVFNDNGVFIKRTTARKLYMSLPNATTEETWKFGNVVFFDNLKHCGIVCNRDSFYHAESSKGINRSQFRPYWKPKIVGVRQFPLNQTTP
jgi:cell wall-associated NlpC family hydrolase